MKRIIYAVFFAALAFACLMLYSCGDSDFLGGGSTDETVEVTYSVNEGGQQYTERIEKGTRFDISDRPSSKPYYTFLGFFDAQGILVVGADGKGVVAINSSVTLYPKWQVNAYTFEFDANGGELSGGNAEMVFPYDTVFVDNAFPSAEMEGYDFLGWYCKDNRLTEGDAFYAYTRKFKYEEGYIIEDDRVKLVAKYEVKKCNVTFEFNDGINESKSVTVLYGEKIPEAEFPTLDTGSEMITGWTTFPGASTIFEGGVTEDISLYPIKKRYKVINFYLDTTATEPVRSERVFEYESGTPYTPEKPGYDFDGWYDTPLLNGNPVTTVHYSMSSQKLYAKWNLATYTLSFETNNGTVIEPIEYTILDSFDLPILTKENFTFVGWCLSEDLSGHTFLRISGGYGTHTLYPKFKGDDKTAVLEAGHGTLAESEKTVEYCGKFYLPIPEYPGYEFQGWFSGEGEDAIRLTDKQGASVVAWPYLEESTVVYAKYKQKLYVNITVNISEAGSCVPEAYYTSGSIVSLKSVANDGYEFDGWYKNGELVSTAPTYDFIMGDANLSLELRFKAKSYTVTLDPGDGICNSESAILKYGEGYRLPPAYMPGKIFVGWKYEENRVTDSDGISISPWIIKSDVTLVADYSNTPDEIIPVNDVNGLLGMANNPSGHFALESDIDLSGVLWTPFEFSGTLYGNGFTIKNLSVSSSDANTGMFTVLKGTVKDLKFENISISGPSNEKATVGGLCAELIGGKVVGVEMRGIVSGKLCRVGGVIGIVRSGSVRNCINYATVSSGNTSDSGFAGGVVGFLEGGTVSDCQNYGGVSIDNYSGGVIGISYSEGISNLENFGTVSGKNYVGGVIGLFQKHSSYYIENMTNHGSVTGVTYVGGIFGCLDNHATHNHNDAVLTVNVIGITNVGTVTGEEYVGGCFGVVYAYISGQYSEGHVTFSASELRNAADVTGKKYVGGLIGYATSDNRNSKISNSRSSGTVTAETYVGGLAGQLAVIKLVDSSNLGTRVLATGYIIDGSNYYVYVGGYVGCADDIENCHNATEIIYNGIGFYVGGIAGRSSGSIINCTNTAKITAPKAEIVGGIAGELSCVGNYSAEMLTNSGKVTGKNNVGGIFGRLYNSSGWNGNDDQYLIRLSNVTNTADVVGGTYVGGCVGRIYTRIFGQYSEGSVTVIATMVINSGNITAEASFGGLFGEVLTDNANSMIMDYECTGSVNGVYPGKEDIELLMGSITNFNINS